MFESNFSYNSRNYSSIRSTPGSLTFALVDRRHDHGTTFRLTISIKPNAFRIVIDRSEMPVLTDIAEEI